MALRWCADAGCGPAADCMFLRHSSTRRRVLSLLLRLSCSARCARVSRKVCATRSCASARSCCTVTPQRTHMRRTWSQGTQYGDRAPPARTNSWLARSSAHSLQYQGMRIHFNISLLRFVAWPSDTRNIVGTKHMPLRQYRAGFSQPECSTLHCGSLTLLLCKLMIGVSCDSWFGSFLACI